MALSPVKALGSVLECKFSDDLDDLYQTELARLAIKTSKGTKLEIESVSPKEEDDEPFSLDAGKRLIESCRLKQRMKFHNFTVKMKSGSDKDVVTMSAWHLGDRWYLLDFTEMPKSDDAEKVQEEIEKLSEKLKKDRIEKYRAAAGGSPESAVRTVVERALAGSTTRARAIAILPDDLDDILDCSGDSEIKEHVSRAEERIERFSSTEGRDDDDDDNERKKPAIKVKSVKVTDRGKIASGGDFPDSCTAEKAVEWADVDIEVSVDGKSDSTVAKAIKVDGLWRVLYVRI
jgi:hypothetical protein